MTRTVWAPLARTVSMVVDGRSIAMTPDDTDCDGWWTADPGVDGEYDYGFIVDDDPLLLPDPRSRRQPTGVHGPSRSFDAAQFEWTDRMWTGRPLAGSVIYELHVGTFSPGGTLETAIEHLGHLVDLGVDAVELMPVNAFNGERNWGYDGVLWFAVSETYGGPAAYMRFVDACHAHGLAVIQDVVYNHLGPSGNHLSKFGPYQRSGDHSPWGASIDLDQPEVRQYIVDNASMWLRDYHVDGLRLDAVHALVDHAPTHILRELADEVDALAAFVRRPLSLIAESDLNDPTLITPHEAGGYGLHAQWSDDFHHALHVALTGETIGYYADFEHLSALAKVYERGFFHDGTFSSFRGRDHGHPIDTANTPASRLVVANQTHDQIGNRAAGDRLSATLDLGQLAIAAVLTLTGPFTPMLFMGEEWGASTPWQYFTAHPEPELGRATSEGRFEEFAQMGWDTSLVPDPQDPATFDRSRLNWSEVAEAGHRDLLSVYRSVIALRRRHPDLCDPRFASVRVLFDEAARWFVVRRGSITVVVNFGDEPVMLGYGGQLLLATDADVTHSETSVALPAHSAAVLELSQCSVPPG